MSIYHTNMKRRLRGVREFFRVGYDVFVSYARRDAQGYGQALFLRLAKAGLAPFIDAVGTLPGDHTPPSVLRTLKYSSMLVIIGSPGSAQSPNIREEVELFARTGRNILVIDIDGAAVSAIWKDAIAGLPHHQPESLAALQAGQPSDRIVEVVLSATDFVRRSVRLRRSVLSAAFLVFIMISGGLGVSYFIISDAKLTAYRARTGTQLEQEGADALNLFKTEQLEGLLLATRSARQLQALTSPSTSFSKNFDQFPAISPVSALIKSVMQIRQRNEFNGGNGYVADIQFTKDGRIMAARYGSNDDMVKVWEVANGREIATLKTDYRGIMDFSFSPDRKLLATCGLGQVKLWDMVTDREPVLLSNRESFFRGVGFSPDGKWVYVGYDDGTVMLWDVTTGQEPISLEGHKGYVSQLAFSPGGKVLATGGGDSVVKLWELSADREPRSLVGHNKSLSAMVFSLDGKILATGDGDGMVNLWEVASGKKIASLKDNEGYISTLGFRADGKVLVSIDLSHKLRLWDVQSGKEIAVLPGEFGGFSFNPVDGILATADHSGQVKLWKLFDSQEKPAWEAVNFKESVAWQAHENWFRIFFSPNGDSLASGGDDGRVKIWKLAATGPETTLSEGLGNSIEAFSPNSETLIVRDNDGKHLLLDLSTGKKIASLPNQGGFDAPEYSPDGLRVVMHYGDGSTKLFEAATGHEVASGSNSHTQGETAISPEGQLMATVEDSHTVKVRRLSTGSEIASWHPYNNVDRLQFSPDGKTLVIKDGNKLTLAGITSNKAIPLSTGQNNPTVSFDRTGSLLITQSAYTPTTKLWRVSTGEEFKPSSPDQTGSLETACDPEGIILVTYASIVNDPEVTIWDMATLHQLNKFTLKDFPLYRLYLSPDRQTLAAVGNSGDMIKILEVSSGSEIATLTAASKLSFSPNSRVLATANSGGDTIKLWEVATGREIAALTGQDKVNDVRFSADGRTLVTSGGYLSLHIKFWPMDLGAWLNTGCQWLETYLRNHPERNSYSMAEPNGKREVKALCQPFHRKDGPVSTK